MTYPHRPGATSISYTFTEAEARKVANFLNEALWANDIGFSENKEVELFLHYLNQELSDRNA